MVKLIIEDDEGKTHVVPMIRDEITIGRKEGNTIRLTERNVSRRHARLVKQNGAIFIEDLGSYNGIKVNGNKIAGRVAVAEGDRIQIGDYVLGLKLEGVAEASAPSPQAEPASATARTVEIPRPPADDETPTAQIDVSEARDRIEKLEAADAAPAPARPKVEGTARLVCVSTNFPGQEWKLDRTLMVIGRTEDNDVVVNHRSISRHHARIVEENGRYTIIDLESSNGVRVNGEEYGRVELRRGDLIDLGHVRLRFVAPGEDFVFSRDASVVDISKGAGGGRGLIWIAVSAVVVVAVGFVVWKLVGGGTPTTNPGDTSAASRDSGGAAAVNDGDQVQLLNDLKTALESEQWASALEHCAKLKAKPPAGEAKARLEADCKSATLEKSAKETYEKAFAAHQRGKRLEALQAWQEIPEGSRYKKRDKDVFDKDRTDAVAQLKSDLDEAVKGKSCDKARELAGEIKKLDPAETEAETKAAGCGAVAVVNPPEKKHVVRPPRPKVPPKKVEVTTPADPEQAAELVRQAQEAYANNSHARAIELARKALKLQPGNKLAIQIMGASACYLKNQAAAQSAYQKLPPAQRNMLRTVCQNNGITLQ